MAAEQVDSADLVKAAGTFLHKIFQRKFCVPIVQQAFPQKGHTISKKIHKRALATGLWKEQSELPVEVINLFISSARNDCNAKLVSSEAGLTKYQRQLLGDEKFRETNLAAMLTCYFYAHYHKMTPAAACKHLFISAGAPRPVPTAAPKSKPSPGKFVPTAARRELRNYQRAINAVESSVEILLKKTEVYVLAQRTAVSRLQALLPEPDSVEKRNHVERQSTRM
jgi:hypothetical protein